MPQLAVYEQAEEEKSGNLSTFAAKRTGKTSRAKSQVADEANAEKTVSDEDSDDEDEDDSEGSDEDDDEDDDDEDESVTPSKGGRAKSVNRAKRSKKKQTSRKLWSRSVSV